MNEDTNTPLNITPQQHTESNPAPNTGQKVIQPSESLKQELQAQQQQTVRATPITVQPTQITPPTPQAGQIQPGMSASQLELNEPRNKLFDFSSKQLIVKGIIGLLLLCGIFAVLIFTNIIALGEFKTVGYTNSKGTNYKLDFYSKHKTGVLKSGNNQLISKVSKDGKFPVNLSISTGEESSYSKVKDCSNFTKVFDVQNSKLNQKISVCDFVKSEAKAGVYIAGFVHNNQAHIITISQDLSGIDLSSQSGAQESLTKFGMQPYHDDIQKIVSSITVE